MGYQYMAKTTTKTKPTLHCQRCGKRRQMLHFAAINTEQQDKESNVYAFNLKKFLERVNEPAMLKLPKFYAGTCAICYATTFYSAKNRSTKLEVVPI